MIDDKRAAVFTMSTSFQALATIHKFMINKGMESNTKRGTMVGDFLIHMADALVRRKKELGFATNADAIEYLKLYGITFTSAKASRAMHRVLAQESDALIKGAIEPNEPSIDILDEMIAIKEEHGAEAKKVTNTQEPGQQVPDHLEGMKEMFNDMREDNE